MNHHFVVYHDGVVDGLVIANSEENAVGLIRQTLLGQTPTPVVTVTPIATASAEDVVRGFAMAFMNVMAEASMAAQMQGRRRH